MDISSIALQGLQQASAQLDKAAVSVASFATASSGGGGADSVDLSAAVVALLTAKNQSLTSASTLKVADEIAKSSIDMMA